MIRLDIGPAPEWAPVVLALSRGEHPASKDIAAGMRSSAEIPRSVREYLALKELGEAKTLPFIKRGSKAHRNRHICQVIRAMLDDGLTVTQACELLAQRLDLEPESIEKNIWLKRARRGV